MTFADGDTLMSNVAVDNGNSGTFMPLAINVAPGGSVDAPISYTLIDPSGQFSLDRTADQVSPGNSSMVEITFTPGKTAIGPQEATLVVNAEGDERTFLLRPFARGAGAEFFIGATELNANSVLYRNTFACVGVQVETIEIRIESIGDLPFMLEGSDIFETETAIRQGTPPFELIRDAANNPILSHDYFLTATLGSTTPLELPLVIDPGESATVYLNFLPVRADKRRARAFFESNGLNFVGIDTDKNVEPGFLNFELVGDGLGSTLSNQERNSLPDAVLFPATDVRETSTVCWVYIQ